MFRINKTNGSITNVCTLSYNKHFETVLELIDGLPVLALYQSIKHYRKLNDIGWNCHESINERYKVGVWSIKCHGHSLAFLVSIYVTSTPDC